jgi:transcriptional regulator ohrR
MQKEYKELRLENQLCFPLYACAKEVTRRYKPFLDPLGLTYTQYITMMVLWEKKEVRVKDLGEVLYLDSGTLTPLLKRLEQKGLITRSRYQDDERALCVQITDLGETLQEKAKSVPEEMRACLPLSAEEMQVLKKLLDRTLSAIEKSKV